MATSSALAPEPLLDETTLAATHDRAAVDRAAVDRAADDRAADDRAADDRAADVRAAINRENAQHSTGPVTPQGKQAVRLNALKSGIYAETVLLADDDPTHYLGLRESLCSIYKPETEEEFSLVQTILDNRWRHRRLSEMDTNLTALGCFEQRPAILMSYVPEYETRNRCKMNDAEITCVAQIAGFRANHRLFEQIWRQQGRLQRRIDQAEAQLERVIAARRAYDRAFGKPPSSVIPPPEAGFVPPIPQSASESVLPETNFEDVPKHILDRMPNFTGKTAGKHQREWLKKHWYDRRA